MRQWRALTLDRALRGAVRAGVPLAAALASATAIPARAMGLGSGRLQAGAGADMVALDADLTVLQVWRAGAPLLS